MHTVIDIHLGGPARPFHVHEDAYEAIRSYLDRAKAGLGDDREVLDDLERSIGERLSARAGDGNRILEAADVGSVLAEVGTVEPSAPGIGSAAPGSRPQHRRLYRITQGQTIAGVCNGLAVYSDIRVDWVRTIFVFAALISVGLFLIVYLVLMFVLPVLPTREAWVAQMEAQAATT